MEDISLLRAVLAILQWWGPNVTVISMNKWLFQVKSISVISFLLFFRLFLSSMRRFRAVVFVLVVLLNDL
ncbi:hypothetical protein MUK42_18558 [Musa troglodytarum]|uniref:Transmembrane protein n=1 Tax=Musa troglodytarum TaxID=320322 RepID=A0A9E7JEP2_9LILI|nr:hypothetical protein MUK42_18558 [Musa troglodytarum]